MNKRRLLIGLAGVVAALVFVSIAWAQVSASFNLSWYVLAGGGGRATSTHYAANSTVGQGTEGLSTSASYRMQSGYWQAWQDLFAYLPLVLKNQP